MAPQCLLLTISGHAPDESMNGFQGNLPQDLDQGITELLENRTEDFIPAPDSSQGTLDYDI